MCKRSPARPEIAIGDSVQTAPMAADGAYNRNSRIQAVGLTPAVALLEQAAAIVELPDTAQPIVIADFGCSGGRNSLTPIGAAIEGVRRRANQPINVVHTDLPDNDFSTLFNTIWTDPNSYMPQPAVFPMGIGRSFYHQLLAANSLTLGWSSWAVAWLSAPPAAIPDHVQVSYSADAATRSAYAQQAASDWIDFLAARSVEMRAGSRLVVVVPAADDDGSAGYRPMFDAAWASLTGLVHDGLLKEEEAVQMGMPHFSRSVAELAAPFGDGGQFAGLTIEHLETFNSTDEFWDEYQSTGNAETFGARWAGIFAAGAFPSLATALHSPPDSPRSVAILDRLEVEVAARLAAKPERMRIPVANIVLAKQSDDKNKRESGGFHERISVTQGLYKKS